MERREFVKRAALSGAALLGTQIQVPPSPAAASTDGLAPTAFNRCLWGIHAEPGAVYDTPYKAIGHAESLVGRQFAVDRQYHRWSDALPTTYEVWTRGQGRIPYVSWNSYGGSGGPVSWQSIADGTRDAWITQQAQSIRAWGKKMYLTFNHEPENDSPRCGTPAEYRAAFGRIISMFETNRVKNVTWVVTLMAPTFHGRNGGPGNWLPSAPYDIIGVDGYNRWPCFPSHGNKSFNEVFAPAHSFAVAIGKPMAICEFGTLEATACDYPGSPSAKATWFHDAGHWIQTWANVVFCAYSHVFATFRGKPMAFWFTTSSQALTAFKAVGAGSYFA